MVPLQDIVGRALAAYSGRLLEAERDQEDGRSVYELKIADEDGRTCELHYDVFTGELLKVREEQDNVYELRRAGHVLPLSEILKRAQQVHPGELLEADLDEEGGQHVYELEIASDDGLHCELHLDAKTGELLWTELDE